VRGSRRRPCQERGGRAWSRRSTLRGPARPGPRRPRGCVRGPGQRLAGRLTGPQLTAASNRVG
jgi:hypothetical protein